MTIKLVTCVVILCDTPGCDPHSGGDTAGHYPTISAAAEALRARGWLITPGETLCPPCVATVTCDAIGHQWGSWNEYVAANGIPWRWRYCDRCNRHDPPADQIDADPGRGTPS